MAEKEKRRSTTFVTSRGAIINVAAPSVYIAPGVTPVDVTNPTELREALGKEIRQSPRSWTFPAIRDWSPTLYGAGENGIMALKTFQDKLYAFQNIAGIIYEFDGREWSEIHRTDPQVYVAYGCGVFTIGGKERLYFGSVYFDGTTWGRVSGIPDDINGYCKFKDRLYAVNNSTGNLYVSTDGVTFTVLWTAPPAQVTFFRNIAEYRMNLYLGGFRAGAAPIYRHDPITGATALEYTTTQNEIMVWYIGGRLFALGNYNIYIYGNGSQYTPAVWTPTGYAFLSNGFSMVRWGGGMIFPEPHVGLLYYLTSDRFSAWVPLTNTRFTAIPFAAGIQPVCVEVFRGKLYMGCEVAAGVGYPDTDAEVVELDAPDTQRPISRNYPLWRNETVVVAGERTMAISTIGGRKSFYLISDQAGTVDIEIDIDGDGNFRTWQLGLAVLANTLWSFETLYDFAWARMFFTPAIQATVTAKIVVTGE